MAHGGDRYRNRIDRDFSINLNPLGMPEKVKNRIIESVDQLEFYPDSQVEELGEKLAGFLNDRLFTELENQINVSDELSENLPERMRYTENNILFGNGASELITAVVNTIHPKQILLPVPSFSGYERAIQNSGAEIVEIPLAGMVQFTNNMLDLITKDIDMLFLTNPNNPTGRYMEQSMLERILDRCRSKKIIVLLDECFMELSDEPEKHSLLTQLKRWPNLLVLRAFTKSFAIPGVRLGYLVGSDQKLLKRISDQLPEWNISGVAQTAGIACLEAAGESSYLEDARKMIKEQRAFLTQELKKLGFEVVSSDTCFMLIRYPVNNKTEKIIKTELLMKQEQENKQDILLYEKLLEQKVLIRDCSDYRNLDRGYYRIAVKSPEENRKFLQVLAEVLENA